MSEIIKKYCFFLVALVFGLLVIRLFQLQIWEFNRYQITAEENAAKTVLAPAPRGVISDRSGNILVENRPIYSVQVLPRVISDKNPERKKKILLRLSQLLGEEINFRPSADQPILIKDNIDLETALRIDEAHQDLPGVVVSVWPARFYSHDKIASHLLGYIGEIQAQELKTLKTEGYRLGDVIGKDGVEKYYDRSIRGIDGGKRIEVDVYGKPTRLLDSFEPLPGADVKLAIDLGLQSAAEMALGGKAGAVVVIDPNNGQILALASQPSYDPNLFISTLDAENWRALSGGRHPFMNRALAIYPPGSIFKVVTLTAALEEKLTRPNETFYCPGYYKINTRLAKCWKESGHGRITAQEGLTQSCDIVFYELGRRLGPDRLAKYASLYGLGEKTQIDIPQEKKGLVPSSDWKKNIRKEAWYDGDSINYGIGQGFVQVTPIQMALVYGTIATGKRYRPYLVETIRDREGKLIYRGQELEVGKAPISADNLQVVREALKNVVDRATGRAAKIDNFLAAGKTGTAQNPGLPHAWFLCYAPYDEPKIVIASFVEHGEHGDRAAAYVARDILSWYSKNRLLVTPESERQ